MDEKPELPISGEEIAVNSRLKSLISGETIGWLLDQYKLGQMPPYAPETDSGEDD